VFPPKASLLINGRLTIMLDHIIKVKYGGSRVPKIRGSHIPAQPIAVEHVKRALLAI
jgi:hypothetical protein